MAKINSRQKGARGERMFAQLLRCHGYEAERGCQHAGGVDSPDVKSNMAGVHWEVKFVEKLNLYDAIEQSRRDAGENEMPLVAHKKSRTEWFVTMSFNDWIKLFKAYEESEEQNNDKRSLCGQEQSDTDTQSIRGNATYESECSKQTEQAD